MAVAELDLSVFNDGFFAEYEAELTGSEAQQNLTGAFQDSVLVQADTVAPTTYKQLTEEVKDFRNRSDVKLFERSLGAAIMSSAAECAAHQHGAMAEGNTVNSFGTSGDKLTGNNHELGNQHGHDDDHTHDAATCKACQAGKPCSKR